MYRKSLFWVGLLIPFLTPWNALAIPTTVQPPKGTTFAQLSSNIDQETGEFVQFESQDALRRMSATINSVVVEQDGTYLIIASPQVTSTKDKGCFDAWIVVDGQDVKNSGVRLCQAQAGNTDVIVSQVIMYLIKGETIQVKTSGTDVKLDAISPQEGPEIPSIILSIWGLAY